MNGIRDLAPHPEQCTAYAGSEGVLGLSQVTKAARWDFYSLHQILQLAPYFPPQDLAIVTHVTSRLDCYNSLYMGFLLGLIWKLQLVQNFLTMLSVYMHV